MDNIVRRKKYLILILVFLFGFPFFYCQAAQTDLKTYRDEVIKYLKNPFLLIDVIKETKEKVSEIEVKNPQETFDQALSETNLDSKLNPQNISETVKENVKEEIDRQIEKQTAKAKARMWDMFKDVTEKIIEGFAGGIKNIFQAMKNSS